MSGYHRRRRSTYAQAAAAAATVIVLVAPAPAARAQQAASSSASAIPPDLLARAGLDGSIAAACRAEFRVGHANEFAAAVAGGSGGRYVVVQDDGRTHELAGFSAKADLSCYSVTEADRLNATIARSDTINGRVTAEWDGAVVCAFIEPTIAVCWQFAPEQQRFVRIGGWTT